MGKLNAFISWRELVFIAAMGTGMIWLGSQSRQIDVNTGRLNVIETFDTVVHEHDANTTAELAAIKDRVRQLENWQQAVKHGQ